MKVKKGMILERNGIGIHIHDITDGTVFYQIWPEGVEKQSFFENLFRRPLSDFENQFTEKDIVHE